MEPVGIREQLLMTSSTSSGAVTEKQAVTCFAHHPGWARQRSSAQIGSLNRRDGLSGRLIP